MKCKDCGAEMIKMIEPTRSRYSFQAFICPNVKSHVTTMPHTNIPCGLIYCGVKKEEEKKT